MAKKHLVIVESPAKAKTIGKYLGKDYEVKASMGHLRDLPKSKLGVDIEHDFEPVYQPIRGKEELISELKKAAKSSDTVYLATDPDREGEAISWHLKALLNLDDEKAKRVTFNEITKKVVSESIQEPRAIEQARPHRGLSAEPASVEEGPPRPLRGPRAVRRRAHGR